MIHIAGEFKNDIQHCLRCNYILTDYRNSMVPEGTPPMKGWAPGASIEVISGFPIQFIVVDEEPNCEKLK